MTQKEKLKGMLAQDKIKQVLDELLAHFKVSYWLTLKMKIKKH